jgi:hypothetical protein
VVSRVVAVVVEVAVGRVTNVRQGASFSLPDR